MKYIIRPALPIDINAIIELCVQHAQYERAEYHSENKAEKLSKMFFSEIPQLYCLVVEINQEIVGYATFSKECSTWDAAFYIHLDCLFLKELCRGFGIGEELINYVVAFAKQINAHHIEWQTPVFNYGAIKFYNRIGAKSKEKLRFTLNL